MEHTLRISHPSAVARLLQAATTPFTTFGLWTVRLGESLPVMMALDRLSSMSDASLAARGVTRLDEVRRILGPRAAL